MASKTVTATPSTQVVESVIKWAIAKWEAEPHTYVKGRPAADEHGSTLYGRDEIAARGVRFDLATLLMVGTWEVAGADPDVAAAAQRVATEALHRNPDYAAWSLLELSDHRGRGASLSVLRSALDGTAPKLPPVKGSGNGKRVK